MIGERAIMHHGEPKAPLVATVRHCRATSRFQFSGLGAFRRTIAPFSSPRRAPKSSRDLHPSACWTRLPQHHPSSFYFNDFNDHLGCLASTFSTQIQIPTAPTAVHEHFACDRRPKPCDRCTAVTAHRAPPTYSCTSSSFV
jgi:hypothetical protein